MTPQWMRWRTFKLSHIEYNVWRKMALITKWPRSPRTHWKRRLWCWWWALKSVCFLKWNNKRTCSRIVYITTECISINSTTMATAVASDAATHTKLYNKSLLKAQIIFTTHSFTYLGFAYYKLCEMLWRNAYHRVRYIVVSRIHTP